MLHRCFSSRMTRLVCAFAVSAAVLIPPQASGAASMTSLTFWNGFTGPDAPTIQTLVSRYNTANHSTISVSQNVMPWADLMTKLLASYAVGQGPDVAAFHLQYLPQYVQAGLIAPIDDAYGHGLSAAAIPPDLLRSLKIGGHYYGAPANYATLMLYWNKNLFKKAGLSQAPTTLAQMQADAVKLSHQGANPQYGIALADHATIPMWPILMWQNGGDVVSADHTKSLLAAPKTIQAVTSWATLIAKDHISPVGLAGAEADSYFQSQKAAMEINGPWATSGYTQAHINYDVAPVPVGPAGPVTLSDAVILVVNKHSPNLAAAESFVKWWNQKPQQAYISLQSGFPPARTDMTSDTSLQKNPFVIKFARQAPYARFYLAGLKNFDKIDTDVITPAIQSIEYNRASPAAALRKAATQMNALLP
ncbi:MAG TPA: ABC transporter substrate-binding protein [Chloroflexota bacterium]|jgi:multiple sugar transport system substrate-binding protein